MQEPVDSFVSEASGEIPPSLLSYFETSKSRATVCEKLIREDVEDFTSSYEDLMHLPVELILNLNEQDTSVTGNNKTFTDRRLHAETEAPDNVTASHRCKDEPETDDYGKREKHMMCTSPIANVSLTQEEIKEISEHQQSDEDKQHFEEQIRRREHNFQMELKKLIEAEKLHQTQLQLMEKKAQEKLEEELLLQQELITNLQKQVEKERRMMAEELKRIKEEEEKKREEVRKKMQEEKIMRETQRMEEEIRSKKIEEENKIRAEEERRIKEEQRRKKKKEEEEEKRKREEVDRKRRDEEKVRKEKQRMEEEISKNVEEENKRILEIRAEEERRIKEDQRKEKEEKKKIELKVKMGQENGEEADRNRREEEEMQRGKMEEGIRRKKEEGGKIKAVEPRTKKEEEECKQEKETNKEEETKTDECNKNIWLKENKMKQMENEINEQMMDNKSNGKKQAEEETGSREEEKTGMKVTGKHIEGSIKKKHDEGKLKENERRDAEDTKEIEMRTRREEERRETKMTENQRILKLGEDKEKRIKVIRKEEEKIRRDEWRKRQKGENDDYRHMEEETRPNEDKAKIRKYWKIIRKVSCEQEQKTDEGQMKEEATDNKEVQRHKKEEGDKMIIVQDETTTRTNELQEEKRVKTSTNTQTEREKAARSNRTSPLDDDGTRSNLTSPLDDDGTGSNLTSQLDDDGTGSNLTSQLDNDGATGSNLTSQLDDGAAGSNLTSQLDDGAAGSNLTSQLDDDDSTGSNLTSQLDNDGAAGSNLTSQLDNDGAAGSNLTSQLDNDGATGSNLTSQLDDDDGTGSNLTSQPDNDGAAGSNLTSQLDDGAAGSNLTSQLDDGAAGSNQTSQLDDDDGTGSNLTSQLDDNLEKSKEPTCVDRPHAAVQFGSSSASFLPCPQEQKRLGWMKDCVSWGELSLQNRRKQKGSLQGGRRPRRPDTSCLPPLCPETLLQATGCRSFQLVTAVKLEDLPGCNMSTLVLCPRLQSLTLRRCGLRSLEGISQLTQLSYVDVTENDISFVDCEDMSSLRVLRLGYNKLTSMHGLRGADNLDVLELPHNQITHIAGLESMRRLQRLSVDHNQLISSKGLRDIYTLLHLNCSHNHLASVEGLENSALLNTLDLRSNSLSEPPSLDNHVLLRELHLDDNSISSLQGFVAACWLPLMQNLSVAQNRITWLPPMSDFVSLANLDLQFNCMSELHNVCGSLEGCCLLQEVHLRGNPLQQENGWRSTLQKALPGLRAIDGQRTDCRLSPPAVQRISLVSDSFLRFCQAQLQQMNDLLQQHSRELREASSSLDVVKTLCRHFTETLKVAEDQRFAHEYGDITTCEGQTAEGTAAKSLIDTQTESSETVPAVGSDVRSYWTVESPTQRWLQSLDAVTKVRETPSENISTASSNIKMAALSKQDLDLRNTAAVLIQQQWRTYRQKHADIGLLAGDGATPEPGPSCINHSGVDQHYAATVIQASWRGLSVRRRLASALAAVTFPGTREDDTFEEVDMDEFVFDEAELEKRWTLELPEDSLCRRDPLSEQSPGSFPEASHHTHPVCGPKQAWLPEEQLHPAPESSHRKSPASYSVLSGISERSEKILEEWGFTDSHTALQMLRRAQNMKWKQQKKKHKVRPTHCNYQLVPVEAQNRAAPHSRNHRQGAVWTELGLQQVEATEPVAEESAGQHVQSERSPQSQRFFPELSSDVLNGGRVQLVVNPVYSERRRASSSSSDRRLHRIPLGRASECHEGTDVPFPNGVTAAPSRKERISFRDNPVQLSGGWGGGKKRNNTHK